MWYVIQVKTGDEEKICIQCEKIIPSDILARCFVPHYEIKKKIQGSWRVIEKILFPGYVFVTTDKGEELLDRLKDIIGLTKLLKTGEDIVPISTKEEKLLSGLGLDNKDVIKMSEGIIEGERVIVTEGSLMGMEGYIRKIDRHKRKAWLEVEMFGRIQNIEMGLEIVEKRN